MLVFVPVVCGRGHVLVSLFSWHFLRKKKEKERMKDRELATIPYSKYKIKALKFSF